ncbi:hypothetical protein [Microcella pacifica]|uniref:Uncharacterized protein n=1 Tax=Microcella pacifica TaxID=2591847 RepID=A0A9E5MHH6_9MICO|nr:hypothetical protein [Microcella pacifica]NHF62375.1 hypothetical protein [Microcella pacifica]
MTGAFRTYRPVAADDLERLEARIASVLGPAIRWQLWLFFPPSAFGGDGLSMPCNDLPRRPPADAADMLFTAIDEIARHTAHTELILALERRGSPDPGRLDRDWMRVVADACDRAGVHLRSVLISHMRGVREHAPPESTLVEA